MSFSALFWIIRNCLLIIGIGIAHHFYHIKFDQHRVEQLLMEQLGGNDDTESQKD